jgi:transposase
MDDEKRYLRIHIQTLKRSLAIQKRKQDEIENQLHELEQENKNQYQQIEKLKKENEDIKRQRDRYKNMLFKKNVEKPLVSDVLVVDEVLSRRTRGGQTGHIGHGRTVPDQVDYCKRVSVRTCPDCNSKLKRSSITTTHTVTDIPTLSTIKPVVTEYQIERQWCRKCSKEVTAKPAGVIPGNRLGINLITLIMLLKYGARIPLDSIVLLLQQQYGLSISKGGIVHTLHRTRSWLGDEYQTLKRAIRASPVKYADETGWRVEGVNHWIWTFLSKDHVCYQVEETRGKGVPQEFFKDSHRDDVIVHDDYQAYKNLPMNHQSCWAHLLRKSHEAVTQPHASAEMKTLHETLKTIYTNADLETKKPFHHRHRTKLYNKLLKNIHDISTAPVTADDAKRIQTRIKNQNKNLLTALLYTEVPLTNNHAERTIRPLVVTRKISGGSRSFKGAQTHMVNMSIFQTIKLRNQPLIPVLKEHLLTGAVGKN